MSASGKKGVVFQLTPESTRNPYFTNLRDPIVLLGWDYRFGVNLDEIEEACRLDPERCIIHLHQLEALYQDRDEDLARDRARRLVNFMMSTRLMGVPLIHTLHNRRRHDQKQTDLERYTLAFLMELASRVLVLGEGGREAAIEWGRSRSSFADCVSVISHQHMIGAYGPRMEKKSARKALALRDDEILFLSLGDIKPYKGHRFLIESFGKRAPKNARLLIVGGHAPGLDLIRSLEVQIERMTENRIRLVLGTVPEESMALWLSAADVAVYGFNDILMSGSVMLALSYGLPVLAPNCGCMSDYIHPGVNGWLYDPLSESSLGDAVARICESASPDCEAILESIAHCSPDQVARELSQIYEDSLRHRWECE